jgi:hypothetical protein
MKSKSFVEYGKLPGIENRFRPARSSDRKSERITSGTKKPRAYSEIDRQFEIERSNKILAQKLIHIANRKSSFINNSISLNRHFRVQERFPRSFKNHSSSVTKGKTEKSYQIENKKRDNHENSHRKHFLKVGEQYPKLPSLISKGINLNTVLKKPEIMRKVETEFTLEDDSSVDD